MSQKLAPPWAFAATSRRTRGLPWAADDDAFHVRVQAHPALGLPVAPYLLNRFGCEPWSVTEPQVLSAPPDVAGDLRGAAVVVLPSACSAVAVDVSPLTSFALEVLDPSRIGSRWERRVLASVPSDGGSALVTGSGIRLVRVRPDPGAKVTVTEVRAWLDQRLYSSDTPTPWARLGLPVAEASNWYRPEVGAGCDVEARGLVPPDLPTQAEARLVAGAATARGPGDETPGPIDPADRATAELARVQVMRRDAGLDLDGLVRKMVEQPTHPLLAPTMVDRVMSRTVGGQPIDDLYSMRGRDVLALAALDPGVARWLGAMLTADRPGDWLAGAAPANLDERLGWPVVVVGAWWVPTEPAMAPAIRGGLRTGEASMLELLRDPSITLDPNDPLAAPFLDAALDQPPPGLELVMLAASTTIPAVPSAAVPPPPTLIIGTGVDDRGWIQGPEGWWHQALRVPSIGVGSLPAGCRLVVRRATPSEPASTPATPTITEEWAAAVTVADPSIVAGRAVPWLPTAKAGSSPSWHERALVDSSATWVAHAIDEFGAWSDPAPAVTALQPGRTDPAPPSLQVHFRPDHTDAVEREGRGWLRVDAGVGQDLVGAWPVHHLEVLVDGVPVLQEPQAGAGTAPFATGWSDISDALPVLGVGAVGQVEVWAVAVAIDDQGTEHRRESPHRTVAIVDGRAPEPGLIVLPIYWTSRATPGGTACLSVVADGGVGIEVHLTDEPRLRAHANEAGEAYPDGGAPLRERAARIAALWGHGGQLPAELFHVAGRAGPGGAVELSVPGRLRDLLVVRVVPVGASGRPAKADTAPIRLYAVPEGSPPPAPEVRLTPGADGQLTVAVSARPGTGAVARWQLLASSHPEVTDVRSFAVTERPGSGAPPGPDDPPPAHDFTVACPPWMPVRVSARLALALGPPDPAGNVACGSWSAAAGVQSFTHIPETPPPAPVVLVSPPDPQDPTHVTITIQTPEPVPLRTIGPYTAVVLLDVGGGLTPRTSAGGLALAARTAGQCAEATLVVEVPAPGGAAACALRAYLLDPIGRAGPTETVPLP